MSDRTKRLYEKVQALLADVDCMSREYAVFKTIPAINELRDVAKEWQDHLDDPARPLLIDVAREKFSNDEISIDDDAELSESDEGTWVAGWLWLPSWDGDLSDEERDNA